MNLTLTLRGQPVTLMVSCLGDGDTGGGLLYYDGQKWICIDDVSTTGLFVAHNELIRILWAPSQVACATSILHYTSRGFARQVTVAGLTDPHDVMWDGEHYIAVSSFQDSVLWIALDGTVTKRYQPAPGADYWHLNSLLMHDGVLYATAFGRFEEPRGWVGNGRKGSGVLFRVDTGADVLTGLCCPHTPRLDAGHWIVCSAASSELSMFAAGGKPVQCVPLQDWVRGLAIADRYLLVGESVNRELTSDVRGATIAVVDRETWTVLGRLKLPYREVYDLVLTTPELLESVIQCRSPRWIAPCPRQIPLSHMNDTG